MCQCADVLMCQFEDRKRLHISNLKDVPMCQCEDRLRNFKHGGHGYLTVEITKYFYC